MNYNKENAEAKKDSINSPKNKKKKKRTAAVLKIILILLLVTVIAGLCVGFAFVKELIDSSPSVSDINLVPSNFATIVYYDDGEESTKEPVFIIDGAHNPQGIKATADSLRLHLKGRKVIFIIGVMSDKDLNTMIPYIDEYALEYIAVTPNYEGRAMKAEVLGDYLKRFNRPVTVAESIQSGVETSLKKAGRDGIVCAIGSLYMPVDVKEALVKLGVLN